MKIRKSYVGGRQKEPAIYIHSNTMTLNAEARECLEKPEFISVEFEENKIILKIGTKKDYKVAYADGHIQSISSCKFQSGKLSKIPNRTKIYGTFTDGKLEFKIPEKYIV